jgi:hypothetical protein
MSGLARVPTARTVSNWLRRFTQETLRPLIRLNYGNLWSAKEHHEYRRRAA